MDSKAGPTITSSNRIMLSNLRRKRVEARKMHPRRPARGALSAAVLAGGVVLTTGTVSVAAGFSLCGRSASSHTQLYFDLAKSPAARVLRATERETILQDEASGVVWTFVVDPVSLVICRSAAKPDDVATHCDGDATVCARVIERLTANPRARP